MIYRRLLKQTKLCCSWILFLYHCFDLLFFFCETIFCFHFFPRHRRQCWCWRLKKLKKSAREKIRKFSEKGKVLIFNTKATIPLGHRSTASGWPCALASGATRSLGWCKARHYSNCDMVGCRYTKKQQRDQERRRRRKNTMKKHKIMLDKRKNKQRNEFKIGRKL